jgi:hypothetical protein
VQGGAASGSGNGALNPTTPVLNGASVSAVPTRRPPTIGKPILPIGTAGPSLPVTLPGPVGAPSAPKVGNRGAPAAHPPSPMVSVPVIAQAPASVVPPKHVPSKSHSKIGQ